MYFLSVSPIIICINDDLSIFNLATSFKELKATTLKAKIPQTKNIFKSFNMMTMSIYIYIYICNYLNLLTCWLYANSKLSRHLIDWRKISSKVVGRKIIVSFIESSSFGSLNLDIKEQRKIYVSYIFLHTSFYTRKKLY